jgi:hypothetical protein
MESSRPRLSYVALIYFAITDHPDWHATVKEIYLWIKNRYPFYHTIPRLRFEGSVRHTLSTNSCFRRTDWKKHKGHYWTVTPEATNMFDGGDYLRRRYRYKQDLALIPAVMPILSSIQI